MKDPRNKIITETMSQIRCLTYLNKWERRKIIKYKIKLKYVVQTENKKNVEHKANVE